MAKGDFNPQRGDRYPGVESVRHPCPVCGLPMTREVDSEGNASPYTCDQHGPPDAAARASGEGAGEPLTETELRRLESAADILASDEYDGYGVASLIRRAAAALRAARAAPEEPTLVDRLAALVPEELARNHDGDPSTLRCTCPTCSRDLADAMLRLAAPPAGGEAGARERAWREIERITREWHSLPEDEVTFARASANLGLIYLLVVAPEQARAALAAARPAGTTTEGARDE